MTRRRQTATYDPRPDGYVRWRDYHDCEEFYVYVHRLIAVAEHGLEAVRGMDVHHKNEIRWDNRPENLELQEPDPHRDYHLNGGVVS